MELGLVLSGWLEAGRAQPFSFPRPTQCCNDMHAQDHALFVRWAHGSELHLCSKFPEPRPGFQPLYWVFEIKKKSMVSVLATFFIAATKYLKKEKKEV